jgi:tRNA (guanine37-N1)-methyltransferase
MKGDLKSGLSKSLNADELDLVIKSYDIIGDISVIQVPEALSEHKRTIAEAVMRQHKHVKAVWRQSSPVSGPHRVRSLEWLGGEKRAQTVHRENGYALKVDVQKCYFSPRLGAERMRIAGLVRDSEYVVNMFAGVGSYSIAIGKYSRAHKTVSIDINPVAVYYMKENVLLNKLVGRISPICGDARTTIANHLRNCADRVLMPLPHEAFKYLDSAVAALRSPAGWVHYYEFAHARKNEDPINVVKQKIVDRLKDFPVKIVDANGRIVRQTGPNWYQIALDLHVET